MLILSYVFFFMIVMRIISDLYFIAFFIFVMLNWLFDEILCYIWYILAENLKEKNTWKNGLKSNIRLQFELKHNQ